MKTEPAYLEVALHAVDQAQNLLLEYGGKATVTQTKVSTDMKHQGSPVTAADVAAEILLRRTIRDSFPTHTIIWEEQWADRCNSPYRRYLDPIDGTREFVRGTDDRGILVSLFYETTPLVSVSCMPALWETLYATAGGGARRNWNRLHVSHTADIGEAYIAHERHKYFERDKQLDQFMALCSAVDYYKTKKIRDFHYLAQGNIDAVVGAKTHMYDIAPFVLLTQEAWGTVTTLGGAALHGDYTDYCFSNGHIHHQLLWFFSSPI